MAVFKIYLSDGITQLTNIKNVSFKETVNSGEDLRPGCVGSSVVEFEVFDTQNNAVNVGDTIFAYCIDADENATLLGKFNCDPQIDTKNSYKVAAYDNAIKLNADFSEWLQSHQSSFPMTVKQIVQQACTIAGVTLGSSSWPLSSQNVQAFYADGLTCRDVLSYAAELAGRFVRCHTDGKVYFDWYASNSNSIAPSAGTGVFAYKQDGLTYANYTTTVLARVAVHPSGEDDVAYIYPNVASGNTLHIRNNLLLTGADASFYNAAAQQVYTAVSAVGSYCPMSVSLFPRENPFRAGDIVSITDAQGVTISAPVTSATISNAAATLLSEGRETYEDTTETAKAITQLASDIVRINKLKVDWADIDQAIINELQANGIDAVNIRSSTWYSEESWDDSETQGNASISISGRTIYSEATSLDKQNQVTNHGTMQYTMTDGGYPAITFTNRASDSSSTERAEISSSGLFTNGAVDAFAGLFGEISADRGLEVGGLYVVNANSAIPNTAKMGVFRYNSSTSNTPYADGITAWETGIILAFSSSDNNCGQLAITSGANVMYYRRCYNGTWTSWSKVYDTLSPPTASEVGAVDKTGDTMTGNLQLEGSWVERNLPSAISSDTMYYVARIDDSSDTVRGGLAFYKTSSYDGIRVYSTKNGIPNGVGLYFDTNGNPTIVLGQPGAWRSALGITADYKAGDTISFPTSGNSYFTRFHGDWRDTTNLYFFIPTSRSCVGLSATVSGTIYLVTNGVRNSVNMSNVTPTCFCTDSGIAVRLTWATAPSYAVQYNLASVQPYGFTVTFS